MFCEVDIRIIDLALIILFIVGLQLIPLLIQEH